MSLESIAQFHFLRPWWFLMILPVLFFTRFFFGKRRIRSRWHGVIAPHLLDHLTISKGGKRRLAPTHMLVAGSFLAAVAMAGPTWERSNSPFAEDQAPVSVVLDLSQTMNQTDIQPSRLTRAKQKIDDLIEMRSGSRTGIIVYAGSSHTVIPLTNDPQVIKNLLAAVETDLMPRRGKALDKAMLLVENMFQEPGIPGTVLLITDGLAENGREALVDYFAASNHQLIVYGMGARSRPDGGSPGSGVFGGAFIPLAERDLASLAEECHGLYVTVTPDKSDIARIGKRIDFHFTASQDQTRPWIDAGYYLLFPIAVIFILWFRKGWTLTWGIVFIVCAVGITPGPVHGAGGFFMDLFLTPDQQGRYYFDRGAYDRAAQCFENALWKGTAYYLDENFEAAIEMFLRIQSPQGYFNLGNAYAHARQYGSAVYAYEKVLALSPGHAAAKKNLALIQHLIDELNAAGAALQGESGEAAEQLTDDMARAPGEVQAADGWKDMEQYSAQQILGDPELHELWMRQVQQDPAQFLRMKFQMQLNRRDRENHGAHEN